jgi:hypothetical protein
VKICGQLFRGNADAVVLHRDHHIRSFAHRRKRDAPAGPGELAGVVEQIGQHLGQANGVGIDTERLGRQRDRELVIHLRKR